MDIFKFTTPPGDTYISNGEIINDIKSKMWIERYAKEGEFKLVADAETGIKEKLPIGTFISHVDTPEIMVVENHEIRSQHGKPSEVVISGESFESFMKYRVNGASYTVTPNHSGITGVGVIAGDSWYQARELIRMNATPTNPVDPDEKILNLRLGNDDIPGATPLEQTRFNWGNLNTVVREILAIDNFGIKVLRPGPWPNKPNSEAPLPGEISMFIYAGHDLSNKVTLSHDLGEVESADYLWTNRNDRNAAYTFGKWTRIKVADASKKGYLRRQHYVDGSAVDNILSTAPTTGQQAESIADMTALANQSLAIRNDILLSNVEISKMGTHVTYRQDFNVGDIITVIGEYDISGLFRIGEFVEIEDKDGVTAYPTLILP